MEVAAYRCIVLFVTVLTTVDALRSNRGSLQITAGSWVIERGNPPLTYIQYGSPLLSRQHTYLSAATLEPPSVAAADGDSSFARSAPGSGRETFDWERQWYPLAVEAYTDKTRPQKLWLLGNELVLWFDGSKWRAFEDSCPHRGVPLSEGRVEKNGELLCTYHAWRFDGDGRCTSIPQTKSAEKEAALKSSVKSCVKSYPTMLEQGLIWVWGQKALPGSDVAIEAACKKPMLIEELYDKSLEGRVNAMSWNTRDLPYGWDMFMENTLDPAHVPVSHHNIVGNRYKDAVPLQMSRVNSRTEIPESLGGSYRDSHRGDRGFAMRIDQGGVLNNRNSKSDSSSGGSSDSNEGDSYSLNDFRPPCLNKITAINGADGSKTILALYCTPTKPGYCRHIGSQILVAGGAAGDKKARGLGFFALPLPVWLLHVTASLFLHQDQVFLHQQERMLYHSSKYAFGRFDSPNVPVNNEFAEMRNDPKSYASTYFTPNEHDMGISKLRRWIHEQAAGGPRWGAAAVMLGLPKVLGSDALFDVYEAHTKSCTVCQATEKKVKLLRNLSLAGTVATLLMLTAMCSGNYGNITGNIAGNTTGRLPLLRRKLLTAAVSAAFGAVALVTEKLLGMFRKFEYSHQDNN